MAPKPLLILLDRQDMENAEAAGFADKLALAMKAGQTPLVVQAMPPKRIQSHNTRRRRGQPIKPSKMLPNEWNALRRNVRDTLATGRDVIVVGDFHGMLDGSNKLTELTAATKSRFIGRRLFHRWQNDTQPGHPWAVTRHDRMDSAWKSVRNLAREIERAQPAGPATKAAAQRVIEVTCANSDQVKALAMAIRKSNSISVVDTASARAATAPRGRGAAARNQDPHIPRAALDLMAEQASLASRMDRPLMIIRCETDAEREAAAGMIEHVKFQRGVSNTRWHVAPLPGKTIAAEDRAIDWPQGRLGPAADSVAMQILDDIHPPSLDDLLDLPLANRRRPVAFPRRKRMAALPRI